MSRTYQVLRNNNNFQGVKKVWVLYNKRGAKKFQRMVNKRCRRLDKIAIAEGINEMIDEIQEDITLIAFEESYQDWYEEDFWDWYEEEPHYEQIGAEFEEEEEEDEYWDDTYEYEDLWY